ncbi:hypothetical protein OAB00_00575, partial [Akkermansiaceae bacterium]|nr:hypothetical protein [Akkermansiaceae bacterium]
MTRDQLREKLNTLMREYKKDQNNLSVVKKIGEIYVEMGYNLDAHVFYSWAYQLSDNDISLKNKAASLKQMADDEEFRVLELEAKSNPDDEMIQMNFKAVREKRFINTTVESSCSSS